MKTIEELRGVVRNRYYGGDKGRAALQEALTELKAAREVVKEVRKDHDSRWGVNFHPGCGICEVLQRYNERTKT